MSNPPPPPPPHPHPHPPGKREKDGEEDAAQKGLIQGCIIPSDHTLTQGDLDLEGNIDLENTDEDGMIDLTQGEADLNGQQQPILQVDHHHQVPPSSRYPQQITTETDHGREDDSYEEIETPRGSWHGLW